MNLPATPVVGIIMGSKSDWSMMQYAADALEKLGIPHQVEVVSTTARRTSSSATRKRPRTAAWK